MHARSCRHTFKSSLGGPQSSWGSSQGTRSSGGGAVLRKTGLWSRCPWPKWGPHSLPLHGFTQPIKIWLHCDVSGHLLLFATPARSDHNTTRGSVLKLRGRQKGATEQRASGPWLGLSSSSPQDAGLRRPGPGTSSQGGLGSRAGASVRPARGGWLLRVLEQPGWHCLPAGCFSGCRPSSRTPQLRTRKPQDDESPESARGSSL